MDKKEDIKGKRVKRPYRDIRAHSNPLSDVHFKYPLSPEHMDWSELYPNYHKRSDEPGTSASTGPPITIADVGCGYGGFLIELGKQFPDKLVLGMEIRHLVVGYVQDRIQKLRKSEADSNLHQNIASMTTNAMKLLPNYFTKGQLEKMYFLFPDPHFKRSKHNRRIITVQLLGEYAYCLREGGLLYTATDVEDLHTWMVHHCDQSPMFTRVADAEVDADPSIPLIFRSEEAKKAKREGRGAHVAVYRRIKFQ